MLFGRSLFAGALVAGLVSASGAAFCSASISGAAQASFLGKAPGVSGAAAAGHALRAAVADPVLVLCTASAEGTSHAAFYLSGLATAVASSSGWPLGSFFGHGQGDVTATLDGLAFRRFRSWAQIPARCDAQGEGEAFSYVYAQGSPALGNATAFGTTYSVGRGTAVAKAVLAAGAVRAIGVRQSSSATAVAFAAAINTAGGMADGQGGATLFGDAAVEHSGHREFECFGFADAKSLVLPATTVVFQPQMATASGSIAGTARHARGVAGHGVATASGVGVGVVGQTAVQGANAGASAIATGGARRAAFLKGTSVARASVRGAVKWKATAKAVASAKATLISDVWLLVRGSSASAEGAAAGVGYRVCIAGGIADAGAEAFGYNQVNDLVLAPTSRTVRIISGDRELIVALEPRLLAA